MSSSNKIFCVFFTCIFFCSGSYAADRVQRNVNMRSDEQLPDHERLATYTAFLVPASQEMHAYGRGCKYGSCFSNEESGVVKKVMQYTMGTRGWLISSEGYTFTLNKKVNTSGSLTYEDFTKTLTVNYGNISLIGNAFVQGSFLQYLLTINLDHNNLKSFSHIQHKVLDQCPRLKKFSARHNAFEGSLVVAHGALDMLDLSYNGFTSILNVVLPKKTAIDLRNNQIETVILPFPELFKEQEYIVYLEGNPVLQSQQG